MILLDISLQSRVIIGISAMVVLFISFLVAFISNQRKKLQYHKNLQFIHEQQQQELMEQNLKLEDRVRARTIELSEQKDNLQVALSGLKASQLQLVQKEKMASLGELASGIAHEIQNPLNFVNNFAEINAELLHDLKLLMAEESATGKNKEEVNLLLEDIIQNLHKINQHGKRADNIVKNLQQHARGNSSETIFSDINSLAEDYLKMSFQSFQVKDRSVHIEMVTSYDKEIPLLNIVPQDIGRVLMNLYNNAFYSVAEKAKKLDAGFIPRLMLNTKIEDNKVKIIIRDNGFGISGKNITKLFQPFFTTKPTGVGTGLGLSLSYEIIKAHQGDIKVDSVEGEYAEFTIEIPAI
jgi:two-component system, NtrC family, sensor kinase